jgi:hypothetical protein
VVHAAHQLVPQREPNSTHADDSATRGHGDRDCTAASQVSSNSGQSTCPGVRAHRHIPLTDRCSSCLFPETDYAPTQCATAEVAVGPDSGRIDAALPFLSFAAGAMAAAEILKLGLPGYPFAPNRVVLTRNQPHELCGPPLAAPALHLPAAEYHGASTDDPRQPLQRPWVGRCGDSSVVKIICRR